MCETDTPADATGSPAMEITASDTGANGQTPAQQEQQVPMMPSRATLEQSPVPTRAVQQPEPTAPAQQLQHELQQSNTHIVPHREPTAQECCNKDSQQQQASTTPLQIDDTDAQMTGGGRDKETQTTVFHRDATVQTDTPT